MSNYKRKRPKDRNLKAPFLGLEDAATVTGLSQSRLRLGCRAGTVPHVRLGLKYLVDVEALLDQMRAEARGSVNDGQ